MTDSLTFSPASSAPVVPTRSAAAAATVVIVTRNRKDELRVAIKSALAQDAHPQILVFDDASTDGTVEMVCAEFPQVRVEQNKSKADCIVLRNRAAEIADTPYLFSIDDDAEFMAPDVVSRSIKLFNHPRVGAVALPFVNVKQKNSKAIAAPDETDVYVLAEFIGTAYAVRRDIFLKLGGFQEAFVHQCEESDYCLRMLAAGYVVRAGATEPISHYVSVKRDLGFIDRSARRNEVLLCWCNVPWPLAIIHFAGNIVNSFRQGISTRKPFRMLRGTLSGYLAIPRLWRKRHPVPASAYQLWRRLRARGMTPLGQIEARLPAAQEARQDIPTPGSY